MKKIFSIIFMLVMFLVILIISLKFNQTPYDFIVDENKQSAQFQPVELLYQEAVGDNRTIVFYINQNGSVLCEILERKIIMYKTLVKSAELPYVSENGAEYFRYSKYDESLEWVFWGIIADDTVEKIIFNDSYILKTVNIEKYDFKLCFAMGDELINDIEYELIY